MKAAIAQGVVKLGIDANALPAGAGNEQGWYAFGGKHMNNEDHSVPLHGYGTAAEMFKAISVPLPGGVDPARPAYLLFTWGTIGVVDFQWVQSCCGEAWIRSPGS